MNVEESGALVILPEVQRGRLGVEEGPRRTRLPRRERCSATRRMAACQNTESEEGAEARAERRWWDARDSGRERSRASARTEREQRDGPRQPNTRAQRQSKAKQSKAKQTRPRRVDPPALAPIHHPLPRLLLRPRPHAHDVGPRVGLGHGE
jgi:hypothetical protein